MFATYGEGAPEIQKGLRESLQEESLQQAEFIATDMPTKRLYAALKETLPNLKALGLDPIHVAMRYKSASARHRTPGSAMLRRGLAKFSAQSSRSNQEKPWGAFFCGDTEVKLTARELMKDHRTPFNLTRSTGVRGAGAHSRSNLSKEK